MYDKKIYSVLHDEVVAIRKQNRDKNPEQLAGYILNGCGRSWTVEQKIRVYDAILAVILHHDVA